MIVIGTLAPLEIIKKYCFFFDILAACWRFPFFSCETVLDLMSNYPFHIITNSDLDPGPNDKLSNGKMFSVAFLHLECFIWTSLQKGKAPERCENKCVLKIFLKNNLWQLFSTTSMQHHLHIPSVCHVQWTNIAISIFLMNESFLFHRTSLLAPKNSGSTKDEWFLGWSCVSNPIFKNWKSDITIYRLDFLIFPSPDSSNIDEV